MRRQLADVLRQAIEAGLADVHTSLPGRIESYDYEEQRASVKPRIGRPLPDGREQDLPVISNVRVLWPESGGASFTMPVQRGDGCLLVFNEVSLDKWLADGGQVVADDRRRHSLQDAVAIMGFEPFPAGTQAENNEDVLLTFGDSRFRIKGNGDVVLETAAGTFTLEAAGNATLDVDGDVTINAGGNVAINGSRVDIN